MLDVAPSGTEKEGGRGLLLALKTSPANRREILLALDEFRQRAISEPGCLSCEILEDVSRNNRFIWMEWWLDQPQADLAVGQPRFRALLGAVKLLGSVESLEWLSSEAGPGIGPRES